MDAAITGIVVMLSAISSLYLGALLSIHLPELDNFFDRKPFNCRPCFTFHLMWITSLLAGLMVNRISIVLTGAVAAFVLFFITKTIDNKNITK
ncbi:hypothetical protein [Prevotella sp. 10(H)]|uniref:hypothetical protein n=1 Tax=Prevotella sp. 10(H) TaxID=1158294 RepID=UPI0004A76286|nr:hypothetical protein [Prevotella sp. 10(H)]